MINKAYFAPLPPTTGISRPVVMNPKGNLFRMQIKHPDTNNSIRKYEIWATKEAIQKHFPGLENPTAFHFKEFARTLFQKNFINNKEHASKPGLFVTSTQKIHGNPKLWPTIINDPEITD